MKRTLFLTGFILICLSSVFAQQMQKLPIDPKIRYGKLENGLTYYIRHNELPKARADFYIAQNVGAILEDDEQNGLAHFLEHMAFNGTVHFPGNTLVGYLESAGVKFGRNLNAYTGFDQTVYNISDVPVREGLIDSCLLILHDWSGCLLLDEKEIDKERGVIREEMRSYGGAAQRLNEKILPEILPGNKYSKRNIIGTEEIIMNFKPETIRAFYKKWYRPDLQGLIIVGDIDPEQIENKLKTLFADIPTPVNPAERVRFQVEDNEQPLVGVASDREATGTSLLISYKHKPLPPEIKGTIAELMLDYFNSIISGIMRERLSELTQQANPPFIGAGVQNGLFANTATEEALSGYVVIKNNEFETGMKAIVREIERVDKYGFTAAEYERARTNILTHYENQFKEKDKWLNSRYANEYVSHFTQGGYIPGIETEYNLISMIAPNTPVEAVNQYVQELIGDKNITIALTAPEKENIVLPAKDDLLKWYAEAKSENIQPVQETVSNEPLLPELPAGGSIVAESKDEKFDATVYALSNGVRAVVKTTNFKDDEILMSATSPGGSSHFPDSEDVNLKLYNAISNLGGLGSFSATDLTKALAGKKVAVNPTIALTHEGMSGSSSVKDFETMLQLIYLHFTAPRTDEDVYQSFVARIKSQLESQEAAPEIALIDTLTKELYENIARSKRIRTADLSKVNYQTIIDWRKERYADASDFTFVLTGNIEAEKSKELIAKYLGALPSIKRTEDFVPVNVNYRSGLRKNAFKRKMENAKATIIDIYWTTLEPSLKNHIEIDMLKQILQIVYTEKVREEEGGTYGVGVVTEISNYPKGRTALQISFETKPGKEEALNGIVHSEFQKIAQDGPRVEDFNKAREFMLKHQQEQEQENSYWSATITDFYSLGYDRYSDYVKTLNAVTPDDIRNKAKAIIDAKNLIEVIMTGE
ncbi:MAG: insulinase family protein [Prevotellaceae bacterium]|jgi:zinc protease|nr:insulinase family protein [Prevotellaceae bacterium]